MTSASISEKSRGLALLLAVPLGILGVHRFYVGKIGTGLLMLLTGGGAAIWWIVDVARIASGDFRDRFGDRLLEWSFESYEDPDALSAPLEDEVDALADELDDVRERLALAEQRLTDRDGATGPR